MKKFLLLSIVICIIAIMSYQNDNLVVISNENLLEKKISYKENIKNIENVTKNLIEISDSHSIEKGFSINNLKKDEEGIIIKKEYHDLENFNINGIKIKEITLLNTCNLIMFLEHSGYQEVFGIKINNVIINSKDLISFNFSNNSYKYVVFNVNDNDCETLRSVNDWDIEFIESIETRNDKIDYDLKIYINGVEKIGTIQNREDIFGFVDPSYNNEKGYLLTQNGSLPVVEGDIYLDIKEVLIKHKNNSFIFVCTDELKGKYESISYVKDEYGTTLIEEHYEEMEISKFIKEKNGIEYCKLDSAYNKVLYAKYKDYEIGVLLFKKRA